MFSLGNPRSVCQPCAPRGGGQETVRAGRSTSKESRAQGTGEVEIQCSGPSADFGKESETCREDVGNLTVLEELQEAEGNGICKCSLDQN